MSSDYADIPMELPHYKRLKKLLNKRFRSSDNQIEDGGVDKDTMSYDLYNVVRDENEDASEFLNVLEQECRQNNLDCTTILLQATPNGDSLLHLAAEFGKKEIAELLVDYKLLLPRKYIEDLNAHNGLLEYATNIRGQTPLHVAAKAENIGVMKVILSKLKDARKDDFIMSKDKFENTALHEAILRKHADGVDFLLNEQSKRSLPRYWNTLPAKSPMYLAVQTMDKRILRYLLRIPLPSHRLYSGYKEISPIFAAISERNDDLLQEIVKRRDDLMYLVDENRNTPLHYAARIGFVDGVRTMLNKSSLFAFRPNSDDDLPIHVACERRQFLVVKELLEGEWSNARIWLNNKGRNILHIAVMSGQNKMVEYLLRHLQKDDEIVNDRDQDGNTPLHLAASNLCLWNLLLLSQHKKFEKNIVNYQGLTARDIIQMQCKILMTSEEFLADVILKNAGVPLNENLSAVKRVVLADGESNVIKASNTLMIVATLITTVTFAAGFSIPGGFYASENPDHKERGMVLLSNKTLFKIFLVFNTIALFSSILGSIMLLWVHLGNRRFAQGTHRRAKFFVNLALTIMPIAFLAAIRLVVSNNTLLADFITIIGAIFIFSIVFLHTLGSFPLGLIRLPLIRQVGDLFIWIILILFYGQNDIWIGEDKKSDQNDI